MTVLRSLLLGFCVTLFLVGFAVTQAATINPNSKDASFTAFEEQLEAGAKSTESAAEPGPASLQTAQYDWDLLEASFAKASSEPIIVSDDQELEPFRVVMPEPASWVLALGMLAIFSMFRRRKAIRS